MEAAKPPSQRPNGGRGGGTNSATPQQLHIQRGLLYSLPKEDWGKGLLLKREGGHFSQQASSFSKMQMSLAAASLPPLELHSWLAAVLLGPLRAVALVSLFGSGSL